MEIRHLDFKVSYIYNVSHKWDVLPESGVVFPHPPGRCSLAFMTRWEPENW